MFVYHPILDALKSRKDGNTGHVVSWKAKEVFNSKLKSLYTAFLHSLKLAEYRIEIKFDQDSIAAERNDYLAKDVNVYIVYGLDAWPRNYTNISNLRIAYLKQLI